MIILGIDPGIAITGFGVLEHHGNKFKILDYGIVTSRKEEPMPVRLRKIYDGVTLLLEQYKPHHVAVEELFFNTNTKTALIVGQARGVIILAAQQFGFEVYEYTPLQVKQAVVGYGRAEKQQVQQMVKAILNLDKIPRPDDAADALAIAICHGHSYGSGLFCRREALD